MSLKPSSVFSARNSSGSPARQSVGGAGGAAAGGATGAGGVSISGMGGSSVKALEHQADAVLQRIEEIQAGSVEDLFSVMASGGTPRGYQIQRPPMRHERAQARPRDEVPHREPRAEHLQLRHRSLLA